MTPPIPPQAMSDADLWEHFRSKGLSVADATLHVERRRRGREGNARGELELRGARPSIPETAAVGFGHGASLGLAGSPTARNVAATELFKANPALGLIFGHLASDPQGYQQYRQEAFAAHPVTALASDVAGTVTTGAALAPLTVGMGPVAAGATMTGIASGVRGAVEPIPGLSRPASAAGMGVGGAILGGVGGKVAAKVLPWARTFGGNIMRQVTRVLGKKTADAETAAITESALRSFMAERGVAPELIEQAVQGWKNTLPKSVRPPTPVEPTPPVLRPGETVEQIHPQGVAISGPPPSVPTAAKPSFWQELYGTPVRDLGKGKTLPYYPRGGTVEQGMAPRPVASPMPNYGPNQNAAFAEFLKGATPQDLASRVGTLRALGVPLPANAEAELLAYLTSVTR